MSGEKLSPILGLPVEDVPVRAGVEAGPSPLAQDDNSEREKLPFELTVIVPARNEAASLPACVQSLLAQSDGLMELGRDWELLLVDDASTDGTLEIMRGGQREGVMVLQAPALDTSAFTGKSNACWYAAGKARGRWLLFTDADTVHEANDLVHALHEAKKHGVVMLSYSPRQVVSGVVQRALMPLVFSELASVYPMAQVNDPATKIAAANGQFVLVEREAYFAVGGHRAVGRSVLEDVDLAWNIKRSKRGLRFRYAPDALSTRMYRGVGDMVEGWTKNLVLLFPHALSLAAWRVLDIALFLLPLLLFVYPYWGPVQRGALLIIWGRTLFRFYRRVARSNFGFVSCAISPLALPMFVWLLVRSWMGEKLFHRVTWKGREYRAGR